MPGAKGKSGGARTNTGPKPKKFTLELGKKYLISEKVKGDKIAPIGPATVIEVSRKAIVLETSDNHQIIIFR